MEFHEFKIIKKTPEVIEDGTSIFWFEPITKPLPFSFRPGQYVFIKNPLYSDPEEVHPFSISSSPLQTDYLEFCIKTYGNWTRAFAKKKDGESVYISDPTGEFVWDDSVQYAVFLLGGIGISPLISMLRYMVDTHQNPRIQILYGNRTPETIAYNTELKKIKKELPNLRITHIFSHIPDNHHWQGYRGFVTSEIIRKEIQLDLKPTFFIIGPPIFIEKARQMIEGLGVAKEFIRNETLTLQMKNLPSSTSHI